MARLVKIEEKDYPDLYGFMHETWMDTYKDIITTEHIETLLHKYFDAENVKDFAAQGYMHYYIESEGTNVGLLVYVTRGEEIYLDKLYVLKTYRGKGYSTVAMDHLKSLGKDITLSVNRNNTGSISIYKHFGFVIEKVVDVQVANGMTNNDYIMRYNIKSVPSQ